MATVSDVAKLANVSTAIVSRVLNADPTLRIREATRQSVHDAARQLNYTPSHAARALRRSKAGVIGLAVQDASNPVYSEILAGAQAEAMRIGYGLLLADVDALAADDQAFRRIVLSGAIDGLLVQRGGASTDGLVTNIAAARVPMLLLNDIVSGDTPSIAVDDFGAARLAMRHLIELGHSRIGHLTVDGPASRSARRLQGWRDVLTESGHRPVEDWVVPGGHTADGGHAGMRRLLESAERPTAVFAGNVLAAVGAISACHEASVRVPEEMSIIGMHDVFLAEHLVPKLTVVKLPLREMGARAVALLLSLSAETGAVHETITDPAPLVIVRESTAPPPDAASPAG